jgi:nicotinate-nucleotide adenylyltransferase
VTRIGIFGGTFDPAHNAHLAIARAALDALGLQQILWMPTGAPAYRPAPVAPAAHRLAMLKLAIAGEQRYAIDERELRPEATGFTYDSLTALKDERPDAEYTLLMGADQYAKRDSWHRWADIEKLCGIAVVARPGSNAGVNATMIDMAPLPISASQIRARLAAGGDVSALLPPPVLGYIRAHGLYT